MEMTAEQIAAINAAVADAVRSETGKVVSADAIAAAMAEYARVHGTMPAITPASIVGIEKKESRDESDKGWSGLAKITQNALDDAFKATPRHKSFDLAVLREKRDEHFKRTGQVTTTTAGGYLIPTEEILSPVDLVGAEESLIGQCNRVPMQTGQITIVTTDGDITVYWVPETTNTSSMGSQGAGLKQESQFTFGRVTLTRHMVVAYVKMSRQVMNYSLGYMENFLRTRLPIRLRAACEIAMLRGTATAASDPVTGLDSVINGDNVIAWDAADPFGSILKTIYAPEIALPTVAESDLCVTNARGLIALRAVKDQQGRAILGDPNAQSKSFLPMYGYPCMKSANVAATYGGGTDSRFYAGDFRRHAHVGLDDSMFILVDPYSDAKNNLVNLIYEMPFGFTVTSHDAFAYTDIPRA